MALVTLDAEKAFDRVWHERLFQKLYNDGIHGKLWLILRDLQAEGTTKVKWNCSLSTSYQTLLLVIGSVTDVLRAQSRFVKCVGGEAAGRIPYTFYKPTLDPKYVSNRPYNEFITPTTFI